MTEIVVIATAKRVERMVRERLGYSGENALRVKAAATPNRNAGMWVRNGTIATTSVKNIGRGLMRLGTLVNQKACKTVRK